MGHSRTARIGFAAVALAACAGVFVARHSSHTVPRSAAAVPAGRPDATTALRNVPLTFERNDGQLPAQVRFAGLQSSGNVAIHDDGFSIADARFTFVNVSRGQATGVDRQRTRSNYFVGNDRRAWRTDIPTFGRVRRDHLYPHIDVVYYGRERQLEYDLVVRPGGDPRQVALRVDGGRMRVDGASGDLVVEQDGRELRHQRPVAYQEIRGARRDVAAHYAIEDDRVGIVVGSYDRTADLVIDPVVIYSTYITADEMFVDSAGRTYLAFFSAIAPPRTDLAPAGTRYGTRETGIYFARLTASGRDLEFSTFIASTPNQQPLIAVDPAGTIYLSGYTGGTITPITMGALAPSDSGSFLAAFSSDGRLAWSRYLGNATPTTHMAPRPAGGVVVAGHFGQSGSIRTFSFAPTIGTPTNGSPWVMKVAANGAIERPAYIGNSIQTWIEALAVGPDDSVYVAGQTTSPNLPIAGVGVQASVGTQATGFITRFDPTQHAYLYSTYFGGRLGRSRVTSLHVDNAGSLYVAGYSTSTDFAPAPTQIGTACGTASSACANVFLTKVLASGTLLYTNHVSIALASQPFHGDPVGGSPPVLVALNQAGEPSLAFSTRSQTLPIVAGVQPRPADGSLIESLDGGHTFVNRAHGPLCESPQQILIAPSDRQVIYVLNRSDDNESALCRSNDGGRSWTRSMIDAPSISPDPGEFPTLAVSPADADTLLFASVSGLKRSLDGGATWIASGTGLPHITTKVAYDPHDAAIAYTSAPVGPVVFRIFKSIDGGVTWAELPSATFIALTAVLGTTPTTILGNAGRRSTDGGATWQQPLSATSFLPLVSAPGNPSVVYGVQTNEPFHAVCRSDDAAVTWPVCSVPPLDGNDGGTRLLSLTVDAADPRRVYGIFRAGLAYSTDGAASWTVLQQRRDGGAIAAHPTEGNHVFAGWRSPTSDVALMRFSADGRRLLFSSYLGGTGDDALTDLRSDGADNLYVLGFTRSANFPLNAPRREQFGSGRTFDNILFDNFLTRIAMRTTPRADFDADGRSDVSVFRPSTGEWLINNSRTSALETIALGQNGDKPAAADFDGDGQADVAVFRPSNGRWTIRDSSTLQVRTVLWGGTTADVPAPADYDGDGKADIAFFRPSNGYWYILQSATNTPRYVQWGGTVNDVPAPGDYDRDGRADLAFFRPSNGFWYLLRSTAGIQYVQWGGTTADVPTPGDYDGDGKTDVAFFRPSDNYWYIRLSATGAPRYVRWGGFPTDVPVPGDYDQDGITDTAFFRPSDGYWYILQSRTRTARYVNLGTVGDIPIPSRR